MTNSYREYDSKYKLNIRKFSFTCVIGSEPRSFLSIKISVCLLPVLSKDIENLMKWQIVIHLDSNNFLSVYQSGFHSTKYTSFALLKVTDGFLREFQPRRITVV